MSKGMRFAVRTTCGLAVALLLAGGAKAKADSGGFYCGYGQGLIQYDCDGPSNWTYVNTGNGGCDISFTSDSGCYIYQDNGGGLWSGVSGCASGGNGCNGNFTYYPPWIIG